ncbi:MAG: hypothetical protein ACQESB_06585 [Elusimicrobiota bacterium]
MKLRLKAFWLLFTGIMVLGAAGAGAGPPAWLMPTALRFASSPDDFFYNLHLDNVDYTPSRPEDSASLRTNFLATTLPLTWLNLNAKVKVLNDRSLTDWSPQVDLTGAYGRIIMLDIMRSTIDEEDDVPEPSMNNYSIGLTLSKAVSPETSLFAGFHRSVVDLNVILPDENHIEISNEETIDEIVVSPRDNILITGISNKLGEDKRISAYVGYGFNYDKVFSRLVWQHRLLEMGFNIYPEGLLVVHPFLGWQWRF